MTVVRRVLTALVIVPVVLLHGCGGGASRSVPPAVRGAQTVLQTPHSVSPGSVAVPPMSKSSAPASLMNGRRPQSTIQPLGWTQLPGAASVVEASPDGSLWALSTIGPTAGPDKYIFHYAGGTWTNIPGAAIRISVGPDNTAYVVNSAGGIYRYDVASPWVGIAGAALDVTVAVDGSLYAVSNVDGGHYGNGIFHYTGGSWTQVSGAGSRIVASWDPGTYEGFIIPGGYWLLGPTGDTYYFDPVGNTYTVLEITDGSSTSGAFDVAPTTSGTAFFLGRSVQSGGHKILTQNLVYPTATAFEGGAANSISSDGKTVYVAGTTGGIYSSAITPTGPPVTFDRKVLYMGTGSNSCANNADYCLSYPPTTIMVDQAGNSGSFTIQTWCKEPFSCTCVSCFPYSGRVILASNNPANGPKSIDVRSQRFGRAVLQVRGNNGGDGSLAVYVTILSTGISFYQIAGAQTYTVTYGGDWGSATAVNAASYPVPNYPDNFKTINIYNLEALRAPVDGGGNPTVQYTKWIRVTVSNGTSNVVDKTTNFTLTPNVDNPIPITIP